MTTEEITTCLETQSILNGVSCAVAVQTANAHLQISCIAQQNRKFAENFFFTIGYTVKSHSIEYPIPNHPIPCNLV